MLRRSRQQGYRRRSRGPDDRRDDPPLQPAPPDGGEEAGRLVLQRPQAFLDRGPPGVESTPRATASARPGAAAGG